MWALLRSSFVQAELVHAVLVPAAVAMLVGVSGRALVPIAPRLGRRMASLAIPAAFLAGYFGVYSNFTFPPTTVMSWLPWFLLAFVAIEFLPDGMKRGGAVRFGQVLVSGGAAVLLLWPILRHEALPVAATTIAAVTVLWAFSWAATASPRVARLPFAVVLLVASMALAAAAPLSGSILLGQMGASLAVAVGAAVLIARLTGIAALLDGAPAAIFILGVLLVDLRFYAGAPEEVAVGVLASVAAGLVASVIVRRYELTGLRALAAPVLIALIPAAFAMAVAFKLSQAAGGGY